VKSSHLVIIGTLALVSGDAFDTATTAIAFLNPIFAGQFEEVGDPFIRFFMYDLGMATNGFFIAIVITWGFDVLMIYAAYSRSRSYASSAFFWIVIFMTFAGIGHWIAGIHNLQLLQSTGYSPF
jgi:hypothetical protein